METETLIDIHTHSNLSPDGSDEPMDMAERACALGVKHFALTDHIELDELGDEEWDYRNAVERSGAVFEQIRAAFDDRMRVYYGAELGQALYDLPTAEKILAEHDYDFVIGSVHRTAHYEHLSGIPDTEFDRKRVLSEYFEEMLALAEWGKFCTLAHMTFLMRFVSVDTPAGLVADKAKRCAAVFDVCKPIIDKILGIIIKNGVALEVNASGYRKGLGGPMAGAEFIARYRELGGRMVTVGSDAHRTCDVARDIPECFKLLRELGFSEVCVFEKREPVFIHI
ncbi:MAG: histidinol-phosphatase HisJ family protein [Lachnospiraceae bacterium]|nr:histidinol-phosphatase HisJ family protein [Ruminococcus sp.]MCM1274343.1 histidinol-phosphatase HisJ family protein [Lachnospiraceae bacterium]